jgi:hypothetical protein
MSLLVADQMWVLPFALPQCLAINCEEFSAKGAEIISGLAPPSDANVNLIEPPEQRIS